MTTRRNAGGTPASKPYNSNYRSSPDRCGRDRLLEATEWEYLDAKEVVKMCAKWMTSDEIYDMCDANEINLARILGD
jgi:hypothetical protein